jgi:Dullard-like phosphatase family protein
MSEALRLSPPHSPNDSISHESSLPPKSSWVSRTVWSLCQCLLDTDDYSEPQISADSLDESVYLEPQAEVNRNTLVLDLDETLIHSSVQPGLRVDLIIQFMCEGEVSTVYVQKRPGLEGFLREVGLRYEVVIFTASLPDYANIVIDRIDPNKVISARLYRSSCRVRPFGYLKDLSRLGRDLNRTIIIDNCPQSYALQPGNAIPISSWFNDSSDTELTDLLPLLNRLSTSTNVVNDLPQLLASRQKKGFDILAEATLRRSGFNSPLHQKTYRQAFSEDEETVDAARSLPKRCVTDSGVHYS